MRRSLRLALLAALATLCGVSPSVGQPIPRTTALRYGLARPWFAQVGSPRATGLIDHINYDEGMVLTQSRAGVLTAIDAETGRTLWSTQCGVRHRSTSEPAANDKYVVVLNGSVLFVINRVNGEIVWQKAVGGPPGAGPGVSLTHAFVPLVSGKIEGYDLAKGELQTPWNYQSSGRVLTPPMTTPLSVSWTTERGYFYVAEPGGTGIRYRLETRDAIQSRPAAWSPKLFACSTDGYVYAVEETKGKILWKLPVGEAIYEAPIAIEDRVYVVTQFGGLYCLDAADGNPMWHIPSVRQFVAKSPARLYVVNSVGDLAILDPTSGARLGLMPLHADTRLLANGRSDRIFMVDSSCVVQCLHEPALAAPVMYIPPAVEQQEIKLKDRPEKPAEPAAEGAPEDPFPPAEEPAADPAPDMPEKPAAEEENPFDTKP